MARTIAELFKNKNSYKYGTDYSDVKPDTETLIEQETTGIRIKSAVDFNNPIIYGNETTRIALRSTPSLDTMKTSTGGIEGGGGLIGQGLEKITGGNITSLSEARDYVNNKLGIPTKLIPTRVKDTGELQKGEEPDTMITLSKIRKDGAGTELGKFLQNTGGGNFSTIGNQALGQGISLVKDKARTTLFGDPTTIGTNDAESNSLKQGYRYSSQLPYSTQILVRKLAEPNEDEIQTPTTEVTDEIKKTTDDKLTEQKPIGEKQERKDYSSDLKYTSVLKDERRYKEEGGFSSETEYKNDKPINFGNDKIDLRKVSPAYSTIRGTDLRYGTSEYAFEAKTIQESRKLKREYNSEAPYVRKYRNGEASELSKGTIYEGGLEKFMGLDKSDELNKISVADNLKLDENDAFIKKGDETIGDLIPLWFKRKGGESVLVFRAIVSSLTESTSPSWNGQKFLGNPYQFYLYEGVERNISFNLRVAAASPMELASIWERLKVLTSYTYPTIKNQLSNPPIIEFRLGSMYNHKTSFIEQLQYTIPDEGVWETNGALGYLPKFVDVQMTLKFIESAGDEQRLYDFNLSKEAVKKINEQREINFSTESVASNGAIKRDKPMKVSVVKKSSDVAKTGTGPKAPVLTSLNPNVPNQTIPSSDASTDDIKTQAAQSAAADSLGGKTPIEATKEQENKSNMTKQQAEYIQNKKIQYGPKIKVEVIPQNSLPKEADDFRFIGSGTINQIFVKIEGPSANGKNAYRFVQLSAGGNPYKLLEGYGETPSNQLSESDRLSAALDNLQGTG